MTIDGYILLVEDNADDELLTIRGLKKGGVINEVRVAHDGAEALELLFPATGQPEYPALVLLDLKLPKVDGFGVLARMRAEERTSLIPVVILTSSKEQEDVAQGYRNGANAYVRKPVNFSEFAEAVRTLGLFWLLINEPPPLISVPRAAAVSPAGP